MSKVEARLLGMSAEREARLLARIQEQARLADTLAEALRMVKASGIELSDPRISYKTVQIDNETFDAIDKALVDYYKMKGVG